MYLEVFPVYFYCKAIANGNVGQRPQSLQLISHLLFFIFLMFPLNHCVYVSLLYDFNCNSRLRVYP